MNRNESAFFIYLFCFYLAGITSAMNDYAPPKSNPEAKHHVAGVNAVEIDESVYKAAKLQNKLRWLFVFLCSIIAMMVSNQFIHIVPSSGIACVCGVVFNKFLSKIFPLADMTSTTKFKKFGNDLRIRKATEKAENK